MTTLITGAAGFTGRYVAQLLAAGGHKVHGLVHGDGPVEHLHGIHEADLADLDAVRRVVAEVRPDHVVHLAAIAFVAHSDVEQMYRTNVIGTRNLLEALTHQQPPPRSVLIASSANIYGNARAGVLNETAPLAPANDYGVSKMAMEFVTRLYASRLPLIVTRPFNYTGVGQASSFLIPKIVNHARDRAPVIELGNLDVERDFSDVRMVADAYVRLLTSPAAIGGTFNICSGRRTALREIVDRVSKLSRHQLNVRVNPAFVRADEVHTLTGSVARLESVIGRLDHIALDETLRWMLDA